VNNISLFNVLTGFGLAAVISWAAWRVQSLNTMGAIAALLLGTVIFGLGGLGWAVLLLAFFISSSALSRLFRRKKKALDNTFAKSAQRDAGQVAANGAVAGLFVLLHVALPSADWIWAAYAGALAAANADTWATELGVLSRRMPHLITTGKPVERGTSGGISPTGTLAALSGSALIAFLAVLFWQGQLIPLGGEQAVSALRAVGWLAGITLAGFAGSLLDSLLGATVQGIYYCPSCKKETERQPLHTCGSPTQLVRGWKWMDNDWVNALCTLAGALIAAAVVILLG
jgi:uncharacterized protein (TIGR00297 family)